MKRGIAMNELQLSQDLNVITAEINSYKQVAGQAIFEIGRRLKHVKEKDLVHGEFGKWLEKIEMSNQQASRFIKVFEEIPQGQISDIGKKGLNALYEIATLPQEEREKEHTLSDGETKTVDEMNNRELREVKRQLRETEQAKQQAEQQAKQSRESEEIAPKQLEEMEDKEPEVIEKEIVKEVIPKHIETQMIEREEELFKTRNELDDLQTKIDFLKKQHRYENDEEKKEKEIKALQFEANKTVLTTKLKMDEFLKDVAITAFRRGAIATSSEGTKNNLRAGIDELKYFIKEMEMALDGRVEA